MDFLISIAVTAAIFSLGCFLLLIVGPIFASVAEKIRESDINDKSSNIIKDVKKIWAGASDLSAQACVSSIASYVYNLFIKKRTEIIKKYEISTVYDSRSEKEGFSVANGYFFYGIPMPTSVPSNYTLSFSDSVDKNVNKKLPLVQAFGYGSWHYSDWLIHIEKQCDFYKRGDCVEKSISKIKIEDIMYYTVQGASQYVSITNGGGMNFEGAVTGGLLFGGAGAIVGSQLGTEIKTNVKKMDDRKILLYYKSGTSVNTLEISKNVDYALSALRKAIPEKDMLYVYSQK